jgi:hypothetical protein
MERERAWELANNRERAHAHIDRRNEFFDPKYSRTVDCGALVPLEKATNLESPLV